MKRCLQNLKPYEECLVYEQYCLMIFKMRLVVEAASVLMVEGQTELLVLAILVDLLFYKAL